MSSYNIKLGPHKGKLKFCKNVIEQVIKEEPTAQEELKDYVTLYGAYVDFTKTLYIQDKLSSSDTKETIVHEIVEACNKILDLGMTHTQIQAVSYLFTQIFSDNKIIRDKLCA